MQLVTDPNFFPEWREVLPGISDADQQYLRRVIDGFVNLLAYPPFLEGVIRMTVVDPLLFLGGFYLPPFHVRSEPSIQLETEDEGILITGSLDTLVLRDRLWVLVVESKRASYSVEAGLAQILAYMMANHNPERPCYGLITSGGSFMFAKLMNSMPPQYAVSKLFGIRESDDLYRVFAILKRLSELATD